MKLNDVLKQLDRELEVTTTKISKSATTILNEALGFNKPTVKSTVCRDNQPAKSPVEEEISSAMSRDLFQAGASKRLKRGPKRAKSREEWNTIVEDYLRNRHRFTQPECADKYYVSVRQLQRKINEYRRENDITHFKNDFPD